jgi:hypothetical protein
VMKLQYHKDVRKDDFDSLEKSPDSTFVWVNFELSFILERGLSTIPWPAWARGYSLFSMPPSFKYTVKATGEQFRSHEEDHYKAYVEYLRSKLWEWYHGARGYLFSPGLNIPSGEIGGVFRVHSTHNFQNWKERVDWLRTIGSIDYVFWLDIVNIACSQAFRVLIELKHLNFEMSILLNKRTKVERSSFIGCINR